ncbi:hypothetical protein [Enterobacter ludwigii]|jgi:hypothetical protein
MYKVSPSHTQKVTTPIEEAFTKAVNKAENKNRVSTADLNKLLSKVKNAQDEISYEALKNINAQTDRLYSVLNDQKSSIGRKKADKIDNAFMKATYKISREGAQERYNDCLERAKKDINQAKEAVRSNIDSLKSSLGKINSEIKNNIEQLPGKAKKEAMDIKEHGNYSAFQKDAAITRNLFPPKTEQVDGGYGYSQKREFDHPLLATWTSLEGLCKKSEYHSKLIKQREYLVNDPTLESFNSAEKFGVFRFNYKQNQLFQVKEAITKLEKKLSAQR